MATTSPVEYARSFDPKVRDVLPEAARRCPGFARRLEAAGLTADDLVDVGVLDRLPVLTKDELLELQQDDPPFAGMVADDARIRRVFQSPGPLYEAELDVDDPWRWAPALEAAGFGAGDLVLNAFGYHLSPAGAMFEQAALAIGARVVPGGVGNLDLQVQACRDLEVTAYIGLPSYLKALMEKAEEEGASLALERAFVTAEPLPPSLRSWLMERVPVVRQGYGTAETGNLGYEGERMDGLYVPADALVQICDLTTGEAVHDDREGQVVVTVFDDAAPVVRFGTGDLSAWATDEDDGPTPRIRGWLGRVGDAVKVRGMFLHPRQVAAAMDPIEGVQAYRFVIDRAEHRDVLRCEVVADAGANGDELSAAAHDRIQNSLRFNAKVELVDSIPDGDPVVDIRRWD